MARRIVLPLDGTPESEQAVAFAQILARRIPASVALVRGALTGPFSSEPGHPPREVQDARRELSYVAQRFGRLGIEAETFVVNDEGGWAIATVAAEQLASLIVMATHARGTVGRSLLGSVADRIMRDGTAPVLLIPPHATFNWPPASRRINIVVGLDGSAVSERILFPVADVAGEAGAEITLVHAVQPPSLADEPGGIAEIYELIPEGVEIHERLLAAAARLEARGLRAHVDERLGHPADVVSMVARQQHAHLIAIATHGRSGPSRLIMGSVAESVLRRARVPVLLCGPNAVCNGEPGPLTQAAAH